MKRLASVLCALLLSACVKSPQVSRLDVSECEARLSDVAIPLKRVPIKKWLSESSYGYTSSESSECLIDFYKREMERLGWELKGDMQGAEVTLVFNRPHKLAVVSMRSDRRKNSVYITLIQKK